MPRVLIDPLLLLLMRLVFNFLEFLNFLAVELRELRFSASARMLEQQGRKPSMAPGLQATPLPLLAPPPPSLASGCLSGYWEHPGVDLLLGVRERGGEMGSHKTQAQKPWELSK